MPMPERVPRPSCNGVALHINGPVVQVAQAGGDRQRELRAGAKTGMGGNDFRNVHGMSVVERQHALHGLEILPHPVALGTRDFGAFCSSDRDPGS